MDDLTRGGLVAALILGAVLLGSGVNSLTPSSQDWQGEPTNYTVSRLLEERPLESRVQVSGNVSSVLKDYESDSGNIYQQFYLSDGADAVKVFCSTAAGRVNVSGGDHVRVEGTFQEFYGQDEIYTRCATIRAE